MVVYHYNKLNFTQGGFIMQVTIGVDVGNFDTKTKHTNTVSGFNTYNQEQLLAEDVLFYDGKYYVESIDNRTPYIEDKTHNDHCLILTLIAIAKEILWRIENERQIKGNSSNATLDYNIVNLAIGLPPGHFNNLAKKTVDYYKKKSANGFRFTYKGYQFSFRLGYIEIYAQDITAVTFNKNLTITRGETAAPVYYIIGIGGGTVDIVPIVKGKPDTNNCRTLTMGTRPMFENIITKIQATYGKTLNESTVENALRGKQLYLKQEIIDNIKDLAKEHAEQIISKCIQIGFTLDVNPCIFVGGGCLLLKEHLEKHSDICFSEFIEDTHANASYYEEFLKLKHGLKE